jgi:hypothetical protein
MLEHIRVLEIGARLDDPVAVDQLIAAIPDSGKLREVLDTGEAGQFAVYNDEKRELLCVACDGLSVLCFNVTDLDQEQAIAIANECQVIGEVWNHRKFIAALERAVGPLEHMRMQ